MPPTSYATTGLPRANASIPIIPNGSAHREGTTTSALRSIPARTSAADTAPSAVSSTSRAIASSAASRRSGPSPKARTAGRNAAGMLATARTSSSRPFCGTILPAKQIELGIAGAATLSASGSSGNGGASSTMRALGMPHDAARSATKREATITTSLRAIPSRNARRRSSSARVRGRGPYAHPSVSAWRTHAAPSGAVQFRPVLGKTRSPFGHSGRWSWIW